MGLPLAVRPDCVYDACLTASSLVYVLPSSCGRGSVVSVVQTTAWHHVLRAPAMLCATESRAVLVM